MRLCQSPKCPGSSCAIASRSDVLPPPYSSLLSAGRFSGVLILGWPPSTQGFGTSSGFPRLLPKTIIHPVFSFLQQLLHPSEVDPHQAPIASPTLSKRCVQLSAKSPPQRESRNPHPFPRASSTTMVAPLISTQYSSLHSEYYRCAQPPRPPPSPPMEDSRCSLPSISKLLGLADAGSPTSDTSASSQLGSPRTEGMTV